MKKGNGDGRDQSPAGSPGLSEARSVPGSLPDLIPARMVNEFAYCPRLCYLEWVQGEFEDNADTVQGRFEHRRVDTEQHLLAQGRVADGSLVLENGENGATVRSVTLSGPKTGVIARIDLVEVGGDGAVTPVDYKRGSMPEGSCGPWEPEKVQLCVQGLILRENGYQCDHGVLYYVESRRRVPVRFTPALVRRTTQVIGQLRGCVSSGRLPPPLEDSRKCLRCSLVGICLPDETNLLTGIGSGEVRRLVPARSDAGSVYVQTQGAMVCKKGDSLEFRQAGTVVDQVRLLDVAQVSLYGNVQITAQALRELCCRGIPVCHYSYGGWFYGLTSGLTHKNVELRVAQYTSALTPEKALALSREFVAGKIRNSRTMLRRNCPRQEAEGALRELSALTSKALRAGSLESLLGVEGAAGRCYFSRFARMLKPKAPTVGAFNFEARNRRPPHDPVNAMLSFVYSLLVKDLTVALLAVGFDPFLGFFHQPRYGRPALALDLMEDFRPIVADSVVIGMVNSGEIGPADFAPGRQTCMLTPAGRTKVVNAYERRLETLVRHPVFGYTLSYRRVLEVQARLLARYLIGEIPLYRSFTTR